jgi:type IV secretory pathway TrbD component
MSTTPTAIAAEQAKFLPRLRGFLGAALFLALRRFPRLLQLHRNENSWALFRFSLACLGAAVVVLPLSLWNGWITAIFGLVLFVVAILLPPAQLESSTDRKARELGVRTVVSGGEYQPGNAPVASVRLFISPEHIWALDAHFHPLVVIPVAEISRMRVEPAVGGWTLQVRWGDHKAEFSYHGIFAERFARLAEESILAANPSAANIVRKQRAAGA